MNAKKIVLATAAASLFLTGAAFAEDSAEGGEAKVKCEGANACKGQSACATAEGACAGKNACKGKGFLMMTEAECDEAQSTEDSEG